MGICVKLSPVSIGVLQACHSSLRPVLGDKTHGLLRLIDDGIYINTLPRNLLSLSLLLTLFQLLVLGVKNYPFVSYLSYSKVKINLMRKYVLDSNVPL